MESFVIFKIYKNYASENNWLLLLNKIESSSALKNYIQNKKSLQIDFGQFSVPSLVKQEDE